MSKAFPGVQALADVSFDVPGGSVHALCGENGAGKSTLLKVLSGVHRQDSGRVLLDGRPVVFSGARDAIRAGVAVIYQELQLVPDLSVAENLYLGDLPARLGWIDQRRLHDAAREVLAPLGLDADPGTLVGDLPIAQRQLVEIGKALARKARVIAFDEPTSSLSVREVERLFAVIRGLRSDGCAVMYVSHRMDEVQEVCDAATVLRDGRLVETFPSLEGVSTPTIVERMVGRTLDEVFPYRPRTLGNVRLEVKGLTGTGLAAPADLTVRAGEIVGVFGLVGAGRSELLGAIYEAGGAVSLDGVPRSQPGPRGAVRAGLVLCPEDRKKQALFPAESVQENVALPARSGVMVDDRAEASRVAGLVERLAIKTPHLGQAIGNLSGGNQQKCVLARWLGEGVRVVLLDEPTRGVDVGAKREIHEVVLGLAEAGAAVLLVSSELPEVLGVSDRILVMREGRIVAEFDRSVATEASVLAAALPGAA